MGESLNSSRPFYKQALLSYFLVTKEEKKSVKRRQWQLTC